jgi:hypothetical protein
MMLYTVLIMLNFMQFIIGFHIIVYFDNYLYTFIISALMILNALISYRCYACLGNGNR